MKSDVETIQAPNYQIQQTGMPNDPGQVKASVYDSKVQEESSVELQLIADLYQMVVCLFLSFQQWGQDDTDRDK